MRPHPFTTEDFCDPIFRDYPLVTKHFHDYPLATEIFCDYHIHDHHSLKFLQPQIGRVRHPESRRMQDIRNTIPTRFPSTEKITGINISHSNYPE